MLGCFRIVVRLDQKPLDAALNVLPYIASLRERVTVAYCKWYIELLAQRPGYGLSLGTIENKGPDVPHTRECTSFQHL